MIHSILSCAAETLQRLTGRFAAFLRDNRAVSTVEYALITVAVVTVVGVGALALQGAFDGLFQQLETELEEATLDEFTRPEPTQSK